MGTTKEALLKEVADSLGEDALITVQPVAVKPVHDIPAQPTNKISCSTQRPIPRILRGSPADIMVGLKSECPRWIPGSVVRWAAWQNGFDSKADADYAAEHLQLASQKWNSYNVGVTFEWVANAKDATFVLCHGGDKGGYLAESFFPNRNDLNFFLVYSAAFRGDWKKYLWKVFTHELGHIMGLRHEFAMFIAEDGLPKEDDFAVQIGPQNPNSVMNYTNLPPDIQDSDVTSVKTFYGMRSQAGKDTMVGVTVLKDYLPM